MKKILIGIKVLGILSIIFSLFVILYRVIPYLIRQPDFFTISYMLTSFCWFVFGIGVLKRLSWARIGLIIMAVIYIIDTFEYPKSVWEAVVNHNIYELSVIILGLTFFSVTILFFTRKTVKEQFEKK